MSARNHASCAIVLGTEVNGIAVIRSLGRLGVRCAAIRARTRGDHTPRSRYLSFTLPVRRDATDEELLCAVRDATLRLAGTGPTVLIPTTDRYSEFLSRNLERLEPESLACCPNATTADIFLDKWKTAEICRRHGVVIPQTVCPGTTGELVSVTSNLRFPVIVKPRYTYGTAFPGKNAVLRDSSALLRFFEGTSLLGDCVIQEIIPSGDGDILVTATYSDTSGRVKAIYSGRKIRQFLPDYGATCFGISERNEDLEGMTQRFLDSIEYNGFAALEFARSRSDGLMYFLELNTRTYYHNQLFSDAGIDLTQIAYLDRTGQDVSTVLGRRRQREGVVWLDFRRDYRSMRIKRRSGEITLGKWIQSLFRARSFAVWDWRDPLPFICACAWRSTDLVLGLLGRRTR